MQRSALMMMLVLAWGLQAPAAVAAPAADLQIRAADILGSGVFRTKSQARHTGFTKSTMAADRVNFLAALASGVCASEVSQTVIDWMTAIFLESSPLAAQALGELGPLDQREILSGLSMPILCFVGAQDAVVDPNVCRSVAEFNTNATLVECAQSGHAPFLEEPELYHDNLKSFLADNL